MVFKSLYALLIKLLCAYHRIYQIEYLQFQSERVRINLANFTALTHPPLIRAITP